MIDGMRIQVRNSKGKEQKIRIKKKMTTNFRIPAVSGIREFSKASQRGSPRGAEALWRVSCNMGYT
jgi:hypothetical protein